MKKIFFLIFVLVLGFAGSQAQAKTVTSPSGNFKVIYTDPLFNVVNAMPGGIYPSKIISVENTGSTMQNVQFAINVTTNPKALAKELYLKVTDNNGGCLWNCDYSTTLDDLSSNQTEIPLGSINPGQTLNYYFYLKFDENAGNEFEESSMTFDITLGYAGPEENVTISISSHHHGDNDNDGGGDNDSLKKNKKKSKPAKAILAKAISPTSVKQGNNNNIKKGKNNPTGKVAGEEQKGETKGESTQKCQSWPEWIWVLVLAIFMVVFAWDARRNYKKEKYNWKLVAVWTMLALIFWYFFDFCRQYYWFVSDIILAALIMHFIYVDALKRKIKK